MIFSGKRRKVSLFAGFAAFAMLLSGCGQEGEGQGEMRAAQVKVMPAVQRDMPLTTEYAGQIVSKEEVYVQSKVSGKIVEKFFVGGQYVEAGQPLYRIDSRQYESAVLQAEANLAKAEADLNNGRIDLYRDQELLNASAIAEQKVTTQAALVRSYEAAAAACSAQLKKAQEDLDDTVVYAPLTGQVAVDDVAVGTFASAGLTTLVTIGSADPVYAQFSISETEYLSFLNSAISGDMNPIHVSLTLADGSHYPYEGELVESDRGLSENTGTLTLKALFPNPEGMLLSGMFARVTLSGAMIPNAILVPQRSVQQLLGKSFVMVVGEDGKSLAKTVTLGQKIGSYYIVESGISPTDRVIVEGLTNLREGVPLSVTDVTAEEMGFSFVPDRTAFTGSSAK